jgi:hypothetical protein
MCIFYKILIMKKIFFFLFITLSNSQATNQNGGRVVVDQMKME